MTDPVRALVGIALAFVGLDVLRHVRGRLNIDSPLPGGGTGTLGSDLLKWAFAGLIVVWVLAVEGRPLSSIGVEWMAPPSFVAWVGGGVVVTMVAGGVTMAVYDRLDLTTPEGFVEDQLKRSVPARTLTVVTAGVTESVLYQGYPIERLIALLKTAPVTSGVALPLAGAIAFLAFTGVHYAGDTYSLEETVFIGVPALSMTVLYVLTGNLLVVIAAHTLVDGISLLGPDIVAALDTGEKAVPE
jgi:membrane protease YdiL (CAAX protease family)